MNPILAKNLAALETVNPPFARRIANRTDRDTEENPFWYSGIVTAKNGSPVPAFQDGSSIHSLFNPEREARQLVETLKGPCFAFFAGLGGAYHIREFLSRYPASACIVAEAGLCAITSLLETIDLSDVLADSRVTVIADCSENTVITTLLERYVPSIYGNFCLVPIRAWQVRNAQLYDDLARWVNSALKRISADYSVQAHFGKIWFRNCALNLELASRAQGTMPVLDTGKIAVIAAAGPGLEDALVRLKRERNDFVIFATDTAWNTLADSGIIPDIMVSIDAQAISASHAMRPFDPGMTVILDICGNPVIARRAHECGAHVVFTAGSHPLARYAASFSPLPPLDTSSGTVTVAALDAAVSLGFTRFEIPGSDFAYVNGKPYARGTYLAHAFGGNSNRVLPAESLYATLMFRTPVKRMDSGGGITYSTDTLERYSVALGNFRGQSRWSPGDFKLFPSKDFFREYREGLQRALLHEGGKSGASVTILPLAAWCEKHRSRKPCMETEPALASAERFADVIKLALELIAGYTGVS